MSPKATEGVGSTGHDAIFQQRSGQRFMRGDPLWPAGHLPLKEGDYALGRPANLVFHSKKAARFPGRLQ
ncbi:hypothetical protein X743_12915 [Mesorhizobium sp. LNHC252B00]|nr:hypothetical protein X743_12915 [Mesorhizobium sp. LNHC252B00]